MKTKANRTKEDELGLDAFQINIETCITMTSLLVLPIVME